MASSIRRKNQRTEKQDLDRSMASRKGGRPQTEDKEDAIVQLRQDIQKTYRTLADLSTVREKWRKSEDWVIPTTLRLLSKLCGRLDCASSIDSEDVGKLCGVFDELTNLLNAIQTSFIEATDAIFEDDEHIKRFYDNVVPSILEIWESCNVATTDLMTLYIKEYYEKNDEYIRLSKSVSSMCSSCAKFVTIAIDPAQYPIPEGSGDKIAESSKGHSTVSSEKLTKILQTFTDASEEVSDEASLEIITWLLCSLCHVTGKVLKPFLDTNDNESEKKDCTDLTSSLNQLFEGLGALKKQLKSGPPAETEKEDGKEKDEVKKFEDCSKAISHLEDEYKEVVDAVVSSGNLTICIGDPAGNDVTIHYRPELYQELAKCCIGPCDMKDRSTWLNEIPVTEDQQIISDIYIIRKGELKTSQDVEIDFSFIPNSDDINKKIILKVKSEGEWKDMEDCQQEVSETDAHIAFKTSNLEAFVAYIETPSDNYELTPEGGTYSSTSNSEIQITFSPGTVEENQNFKMKTIPFDYRKFTDLKEKYPDAILGIAAISDAVEMWTESDVTMLKNTLVQLPMDDDDDNDTQLVVIRYKGNQIQVLDKSQCHVKKEKGLYKVESRGVWSFAVAKIRKIFLNMRDTVKREFQIIFGKVQLCNICTFIDDTQRDMETGSFFLWIECIEKSALKDDLEEKRKAGYTEVKNSRSKDLTIRQNQTIILTVDGQVRIRDPDPPENFRITYLIGADNHLNIPMEVRRSDQDKMPYAILSFCDEGNDHPLHNVNISVRDLAELPTEEITARQLTKNSENNNLREAMKKRDEAARNMLSLDSLMTLSRQMTINDGLKIGVQLGVPMCRMEKLKEQSDDNTVRTNFQILCEWRGSVPRSAMVDFLITSLRSICRNELATVVTNVRKSGRELLNTDFA